MPGTQQYTLVTHTAHTIEQSNNRSRNVTPDVRPIVARGYAVSLEKTGNVNMLLRFPNPHGTLPLQTSPVKHSLSLFMIMRSPFYLSHRCATVVLFRGL